MQALKEERFGFVSRAIVNTLVDAYPRGVNVDALAQIVYSGREPETAPYALRVAVAKLRPKLELHGWTIPGGRPRGRRGAWDSTAQLYRLVKLSESA